MSGTTNKWAAESHKLPWHKMPADYVSSSLREECKGCSPLNAQLLSRPSHTGDRPIRQTGENVQLSHKEHERGRSDRQVLPGVGESARAAVHPQRDDGVGAL